jgi:hypothetical protein
MPTKRKMAAPEGVPPAWGVELRNARIILPKHQYTRTLSGL